MKISIRILTLFIFIAFAAVLEKSSNLKAGPFGKCGSIVVERDGDGIQLNCVYHFFKCDCLRKGDWPLK